MTHGFVAVFSRNNLNLSDKESGLIKPNEGFTSIQLSSSLSIYISTPKNPSFIQSWTAGAWAFIGIGDQILNEALKEYFNHSDSAFNEEKINSNIEPIIKTNPGQYCGVLFNENTGQLVQITDPLGCRSLFVFDSQNIKIVASSLPMIKNIVSDKYIKPNVDSNDFLLRYAYSLPGETVYKNIYETEPKLLTSENIRTNKNIQKNKIVLDNEQTGNKKEFVKNKIGKSRYEHELYERLLLTCEQQVGKVKKVGVLLGGFDSALVVSLLKKLDIELETYSFYYRDTNYNQPYIDELAAQLDITHRWVEIDPAIIKFGIGKYGSICNWPTLWLNYIIQTQHLCNQMIENGVEVCFSGDGCDSAFLGYPSTYRRGNVYQMFPRLSPRFANLLKNAFHVVRLEYVFGHIARVLLSLIDASQYSVEKRPLYSFQIFNDKSFKRLTGRAPTQSSAVEKYFLDRFKEIINLSYERKIYFTKNFISPNRCKIVSSSDISGLAVYSPYLHPLVRSYAQKLPDEAMRPTDGSHSKEGKYILMKMAEDYKLLPRNIIYQKKVAAIHSPIDEWLSKELNEYALDHISSLPFNYSKSYVNSLLAEQTSEKLYKKYFSDDGVVSLAPSLLITLASFFE